MNKVIAAIVALASVSTVSASLDYSPRDEGVIMCNEVNGTMVYTQFGGTSDDFHGIQHAFCKTHLGVQDSQTILLDAESGFNTRTIASTMLKHIGLINTTQLLKGQSMSASNAAVLCPKLYGSQSTDYSMDLAFFDEDGVPWAPCVFADGSMAGGWSLIFSSQSIVLPDNNPTQSKLRREVIRDSMTMKLNIPDDDGIFIKPRDAKTCNKNLDCKEFKVDPCTGEHLEESLVCHTGICVKPPAECQTRADCHGRAMVRGYEKIVQGYCLNQKCEDGYCIADYTDVMV